MTVILTPISGYAQGANLFQKKNNCYIRQFGVHLSILFSNPYSNYVTLLILPSIYLHFLDIIIVTGRI